MDVSFIISVVVLLVFAVISCGLPESRTYKYLFYLMGINLIYGVLIVAAGYDGEAYDYFGLATIDACFAFKILKNGDLHKIRQSTLLATFISCYVLVMWDIDENTSIIFHNLQAITWFLTALMALVGFHGIYQRISRRVAREIPYPCSTGVLDSRYTQAVRSSDHAHKKDR